MTTITGEIAYLERIALLPGGTATITLSDTSLQDASATLIAETTIELGDRQVPIPFELVAETGDLDERGMYSVRATISGPDGSLQWTTDTANIVDISQVEVDLGTLRLVNAAGSATAPDTDAGADASSLVGEWTITEIDGTATLENAPATLVFGDDGTLGSDTGCNSVSASYATSGELLTVESEPVMTRKACDPERTAQETAIVEIFNAARTDGATFAVTDDGAALTITTSDGVTLSARR